MPDFYILSLSHTTPDSAAKWWGPNNCGYTENLEQAGRYSAEQVRAKADYYDNGESTRAVPCMEADIMASRRIDGYVAVRAFKGNPAPVNQKAVTKEARK